MLEHPVGWARVSFRGYQVVGVVCLRTLGGVPVVEVRRPVDDEHFTLIYYSPAAILSITPISEEDGREFLAGSAEPPEGEPS